MTLRIKSNEMEIRHWPATSGDVALALRISQSLVRYYALLGVARPHTDSRGRRLYMPEHLTAIKNYRAARGRKK